MYDLFIHLVDLGDLAVLEYLVAVPLGIWLLGFLFPAKF